MTTYLDKQNARIRVALRSGDFTLTDFVSSKIGEDVNHQTPQHMEGRISAV